MTVEPRASWSKRAMNSPDRHVPYTPYMGAAVHWPGDKGLSLKGKPHSACQQALVGIENYQMDSAAERYGAIAYQVVVCGSHGKIIEGRTRRKVNGANGDNTSNIRYGSILALIGMSDPVTDELLTGILDARQYLGVTKLFTHNDVRPQATACPGPDLTRWIKAGYPDPGDDMDWSDRIPLTPLSQAEFGTEDQRVEVLLSWIARDSRLARESSARAEAYARAAAQESGLTPADLSAIAATVDAAIADGIDVNVTVN